MNIYTTDDIFSLSPSLLKLKNTTGILQLIFAMLLLLIYYFLWEEKLLQIAGVAIFSVGLFTYGFQFQNVIVRSRKEIHTVRGFLFFTFENRYSNTDCQELIIGKSVRNRRDSANDISTKGTGRLDTAYKLKIKLKNGKSFEFSSSSSLEEMEMLGREISTILGCSLTLPEKNKNIHHTPGILMKGIIKLVSKSLLKR